MEKASRKPWSLNSWRNYFLEKKYHFYGDDKTFEVEIVLGRVRASPALIKAEEVETLKNLLKDVRDGGGFIIQGGDCAEPFKDNEVSITTKKLETLQNLGHKTKSSVVIGRIAGQYAKPRSNIIEADGSVSYMGDIINGIELNDRSPDPNRMLMAYQNSSDILNQIEVFSKHRMTKIFSSHEALLLPYEEALTRKEGEGNKWYNLGAHMVWIGHRTRQLNHAHIEYVRGIENPVGIKIGCDISDQELFELLQLLYLNRDREEAKIILITRYGVQNVAKILPGHIKAVQSSGFRVLWFCDPCHGNTHLTRRGFKTRYSKEMMDELGQVYKVHEEAGSRLHGIHLEMTAEFVEECNLSEDALPSLYTTFCDPRLNHREVAEFADFILKLRSCTVQC